MADPKHDPTCVHVGTTHICVTAEGLDELSPKEQRSEAFVLHWLKDHKRFSAFEATSSKDVARTLDRILRAGWIVYDRTAVFPWCHVTLTPEGEVALKAFDVAAKLAAGEAPP